LPSNESEGGAAQQGKAGYHPRDTKYLTDWGVHHALQESIKIPNKTQRKGGNNAGPFEETHAGSLEKQKRRKVKKRSAGPEKGNHRKAALRTPIRRPYYGGGVEREGARAPTGRVQRGREFRCWGARHEMCSQNLRTMKRHQKKKEQ